MDIKGAINRENKIGPKMEPCGTLQEMGAEEGNTLSALREGDLPWKYEENH